MYRIIIFLIFSCLFQVPEAQAREKNDIDSLKNMLQLATKADSIEIFLLLGEEYYSMEDYSTALDIFFSCLKLSESINLTSRSADASNNIGRIYYDMENYGEALRYFNKALNYFIITKDEPRQGGVFNNIALIYYELDSIDLAVEFYTKALEIKQKYGGKLDMATIYHNLGLVYMHTNQVDLAVKNLESSRKIFIDLGFEKYAVNTTNNIGRALYRDGRYQEALNYYEEGLKEAKNINSAFLIMDNYKYQADCYAKLDNYEAAYRFTNEYYNLKDSLLNLDKEKELAEIHARYENEISEQENEILKNENEAKAATIKMQFMLVIGILIIFMLVGVLAIIYYRANQSKKKANKLLYSQKVEIQEKNDVLSRLNEEITNQNNAIKKQKKELEELNGIKDKLFSIISHEFRSPLNSLKGTLALLKLGALSDEELNVISKELTDKINSTSIFLDNLLNWAKSQMQGINPKPASLDLYELADPNMLNLILRNLISNAIKFSMRGGIIRVQTITENGMNTISVSDSGIGMTEENIKMLFQVQTFTTRGTANERGTGLGLYISKNFIESNGGEIWVESEEGKGSVFNFTVPTGA
jgi:two-component system, sensor histidine kinase and response regulator